MPAETTAAGVAPIDAIVGPLVDTGLNEFGHALFEMLRLPVLGREEDAADQVSAYIMLQLGKVEARRLIGGRRLRVQGPRLSRNANTPLSFVSIQSSLCFRKSIGNLRAAERCDWPSS